MRALRSAPALLGVLAGCSSSASLEHVRTAPNHDGITLYVHAQAPTVVQGLPSLLHAQGYAELSSETSAARVAVRAAKRSSKKGFGNAVRVIVEPASVPDYALVRLTFARRLRLNESEDLDAARDALVSALRMRFGGP